jgi:hypothetical protein
MEAIMSEFEKFISREMRLKMTLPSSEWLQHIKTSHEPLCRMAMSLEADRDYWRRRAQWEHVCAWLGHFFVAGIILFLWWRYG